MATILTLSSEVVAGHIGNAAARFVLQRLGHTVWSLPTVVLSNHPGHSAVAGTRISPETLTSMLDALDRNGWLGSVDAVMTGYLPSSDHVSVASSLIDRVRAARPGALVLVDPVLGDDPKGLYIEQAAAEAIRDALIGKADVITPNRFELAWLTQSDVHDAASAIAAARQLPVPYVVATSIAGATGTLATVLTAGSKPPLANAPFSETHTYSVTRRDRVPHGTGDTLAALLLGQLLRGLDLATATAAAVAGVDAIVAASAGKLDLDLPGTQTLWAGPATSAV
jgi:pyridoxine kinase